MSASITNQTIVSGIGKRISGARMRLIAFGTKSAPVIVTSPYAITNKEIRHALRCAARYQITIPHVAITADCRSAR